MPCTFKQSIMSWLQEFDMPPMTIAGQVSLKINLKWHWRSVTHLVSVRWRRAPRADFNKAAWEQMAPTEPRNNPGTKTAAQAMVLPAQTEHWKLKMLRKSEESLGANEEEFTFLLVLLWADLMAKQLRASFTLTKFLPLFKVDSTDLHNSYECNYWCHQIFMFPISFQNLWPSSHD